MCFLFKDVIEIRKKLFKNREEWMSYVSADYDPDVLEKEPIVTGKQIGRAHV